MALILSDSRGVRDQASVAILSLKKDCEIAFNFYNLKGKNVLRDSGCLP
jgi:hypothetical protein